MSHFNYKSLTCNITYRGNRGKEKGGRLVNLSGRALNRWSTPGQLNRDDLWGLVRLPPCQWRMADKHLGQTSQTEWKKDHIIISVKTLNKYPPSNIYDRPFQDLSYIHCSVSELLILLAYFCDLRGQGVTKIENCVGNLKKKSCRFEVLYLSSTKYQQV